VVGGLLHHVRIRRPLGTTANAVSVATRHGSLGQPIRSGSGSVTGNVRRQGVGRNERLIDEGVLGVAGAGAVVASGGLGGLAHGRVDGGRILPRTLDAQRLASGLYVHRVSQSLAVCVRRSCGWDGVRLAED